MRTGTRWSSDRWTGMVNSVRRRRPGAKTPRSAEEPWTRQQLWAATHAERAALVADLDALAPADWARPSLCAEWTVEEVVAHLTAAARVGLLAWVRSVLAARLDVDLHNQRRLAEHRGSTPEATLSGLRDAVTSTVAPSRDTAAWLGEVIVHAQDIRRPLGIPTTPDRGAVVQVARFYAGKDFAVPSRTLVEGLRLEADDAAFAAGPQDGDLVRGPVLALTMVMAGRTAYLVELDGPGVPTLRTRLADAGPTSPPR